MEIVKDPYLERLRAEVAELKRIVDGEPDATTISRAWATFDMIKDALAHLCPNHPQIWAHR